MKAVIYARYSSDSQREESIEGQIRECTDYAERNDILVLDHYIDRALSARTADRPAFQKMIADSEKGLFDVVIVWKLDRFSRDRYDSAHYKRILKRNGVKVISAKENISDGPEGIILESMLEGYAEYYSAELSQKIQRGQHDNAMKCKSNGGNIPVGYVVGEEGALMPDPEMALVVQEIFSRYDSGQTMSEIKEMLNFRGVRTKKGKELTVGGISVILHNRKYIGEYKYGDVVIPDGIPAIIETEIFERVQRRLASNKKAPARYKAPEEYLLTTKLFCGHCGRLMAGESGKNGKGVTYHYYKCSGAKRKLGCKKKAVKKDWMERAAVLLTVQRVLHDDEIDRIATVLVDMQTKDDPTVPALLAQLAECEKGITNMLNAIQMGILTSSTKERLEALEKERATLKANIAHAQMQRPVYTKDQIVRWMSRFKGGDISEPTYRKQIIDIFLNSIYVYDDKLVFTYNFKDGTETISLAEVEAALCSDLTCLAPPKNSILSDGVLFCCPMDSSPSECSMPVACCSSPARRGRHHNFCLNGTTMQRVLYRPLFPHSTLRPVTNRPSYARIFLKGGDNMDAATVGKRIAELRKEQGLTQKELAAKLHITDGAVSKWERGINFPDLALIEPLAAALNTNVIQLLSLERATKNEVASAMSDISMMERERLIKDLKKRALRNIMNGLILLACLSTASIIFRDHNIYGLAQGVTMGAMGFVGTIIGSEIYLIRNIGKI